jgi:hypothetical protein
LASAAVHSPLSTLYVASAGATPQTVTVGSFKSAFGKVCSITTIPGVPPQSLVPLTAVVEFGTLFTPPFKVVRCHADHHHQ